jgi:broad specificity phosphatase PhoE
MITITFIPHKNTDDNEKKVASGWTNVPLSELGKQQSLETKKYFVNRKFHQVFCSDLQRSYDTGVLVFRDHLIPIMLDWRLRECNYGDMNSCPKKKMEDMRLSCILEKYPNGESYEDCIDRMRDFLKDLKLKYENCSIVIVGHRATQYSLEYICLDKKLEDIVVAPWSWQEEWSYILD